MPGVSRISIDKLIKEVEALYKLGIRAVDLFAYVPPEKKDPMGSEALRSGNLIERSLKALKREIPDMCLMVDVALDPYTDHGHDGLVDADGSILNDVSVEALAEMSLMAAEPEPTSSHPAI